METVMTKKEWERNYRKSFHKNYKRKLRKKFCKGILVSVFVLGAIGCAGASDFEDTGCVERNGIFCEIEGKQYICTEDGSWEVANLEFSNGDKVSVVFYGNYTDEVTDDVIANVETRWF